MAEIEFKRRGTPVWAVLLVLLVLAGILYGIFARRAPQTAVAPADSVTTPTGPAAPGAGTPGAPPAPAPLTPTAALAAWADSAQMPSTAAGAAQYVERGLRLLGPALHERAPMAGGQQVLVNAMADTLAMPNLAEAKQTDVTQAAFYAVAYATRGTPSGPTLENAAAAVQLKKPLTTQKTAVEHFFKAAAAAMQAPNAKAPAATPAPAAATAPTPAPAAKP